MLWIIPFTTNQTLLVPLISKVRPSDAPKSSISSSNDIDHCPTDDYCKKWTFGSTPIPFKLMISNAYTEHFQAKGFRRTSPEIKIYFFDSKRNFIARFIWWTPTPPSTKIYSE